MAKIKPLPTQLANQIAAGEVIDRPASVVKELIENSLDAKATQITVDLIQGGASRITICDDGQGIAKEELALALERHATSKIAVVEDLNHILSLGFRGEALASIASVAKCVLSSKPQDQEQAWSCSVKGHDQTPYLFPASTLDGTQLVIQDLFYNVPARRKFLKSSKTEMNHIEQVVKKAALSHPEVGFHLIHNEKTIFQFKKTQSWANRVEQVCKKKFMDNAYELQVEHGDYQLRGWLGNQQVFRKHADCQYFFINQRPVRDKILQHAIKNAFFQLGFNLEQNFPSYVLFLECPTSEVDVNVHPTKHEVRFHDPSWVHDFIQKCLTQALTSNPNVDEELRAFEPTAHTKPKPVSVSNLVDKPQSTLYQSDQSLIEDQKEKLETPETPETPAFPMVSLDLGLKPPKSKNSSNMVFWHHYGLVFKDVLWVLDLKKYQKKIWRKMMAQAKSHPWPSRMTVFPLPATQVCDEATWETFGVRFRKNLTGKWQCVEVPAFLDMAMINEFAKHLDSQQKALAFFEQLPWQVLTQHTFFQERLYDWFHESKDWLHQITLDDLAELVGEQAAEIE